MGTSGSVAAETAVFVGGKSEALDWGGITGTEPLPAFGAG